MNVDGKGGRVMALRGRGGWRTKRKVGGRGGLERNLKSFL